jgi:hypothetical protein
MRTSLTGPVLTAALVAMLTSTSQAPLLAQSNAPDAPAARRGDRSQGQFCRRAPTLPMLAAEPAYVDDNQQQQPMSRRGAVRSRGDDAASVAMPSPPPPAYAGSDGEEDMVVTGSRVEASREASPSAPTADAAAPAEGRMAGTPPVGRIMPPPRPYPPRPRPAQAGILTAGEHDDLLNPLLYARYVNRSDLAQAIPDLPRLDTSNVLTVRAVDGNGRGVAFANVTLTCADGSSLTMATQADGAVTFFPALDRLSRDVSLSVRYSGASGGGSSPQRLTLTDGAQSVDLRVGTRAGAAPRRLDIAFAIDTTGSMGDEIRYLQAELGSIIRSLRTEHPGLDLRVGFVFYRDTTDDYITRTIGFTPDIARAQAVLGRQYASGGGDYPEAMEQALIRAVNLDWRPNAIKSLILVADAPPHDEHFGRAWAAAEVARDRRIHIVPVAASGVAARAEYGMRAMAALTQSRYLFLTDDSGVGNAHAEPSVDCYLVTRLNDALRRTIASQLSGRRIEPGEQEVVRSVGDYDNGRCILPADFSSAQ